MNRQHSARYLILLGTAATQRALLFNGDHCYLAELDHDDFAVENLRRAGKPCSLPGDLQVATMAANDQPLECFALG